MDVMEQTCHRAFVTIKYICFGISEVNFIRNFMLINYACDLCSNGLKIVSRSQTPSLLICYTRLDLKQNTAPPLLICYERLDLKQNTVDFT